MLRVATVLLTVDGDIALWPPMAEEILGWPDDRAVGRPLTDFTPDGRAWAFEPAPGDRHWRGTLTLRHRDGHLVELACRATRLDGAGLGRFILANLVETSRMTAVEQDLAAVDSLFTASQLGVALFDAELRYTRVNDALTRLHGTPAEAVLGRTVLDVLPPPMAGEIHRLQREVLRSGRSVTDLVTASPDGRGAQSVSFGRLTDHSGRAVGVSCVVLDITERRDAMTRVERARQRLALLDDVGIALGDLLEVRLIAETLCQSLVPRFGDYCSVEILKSVVHGEEPPPIGELADVALIQLGTAAKDHGPAVEMIFESGRDLGTQHETVFENVLTTGVPHLAATPRELGAAVGEDDPRVGAARELGIHCLLTVPLRARGTVLGLMAVSRAGRRTAFDREDLTLAMEVANRAAISLDNARLYVREREGALMLQRSLLPRSLPDIAGVEVGHRYLPSATGTEIGGDWFDVIPLTGGRVAFVVGDATGHGLRAATVMGRLRTAARTLAGLELPPAEVLRRLNDLGADIAQHPDDPLLATCVYAAYDPATGICALATAGHLPPVLAGPDPAAGGWTATALDLPPGTPLGIEGATFTEHRIDVPEGSLLVLYTDGLIENRGEDLTSGIDRLCALLTRTTGPGTTLEEVCDGVIQALRPRAAETTTADDIAMLAARLGRLPGNRAASWTFPAERAQVRRARHAVADTLRAWGLDPLTETARLLVSELVTNAVRHAHGPVEVRMALGASLLIEVTDPVTDPPCERSAAPDDEGGRGLPLVARVSRGWGTRRRPVGKTVWFELDLPGGPD
ncbi:SpoIIE family protein phosphatase [Streptomyces specialis]|uniref:SpoIIE family protein phosphatase n=1 Tax=Streptomyces specialis TaxID=498367 RepID=UPI00073EA43F|nr:SpoIIE family protein phosphatase [Streptomyces specialis]